MQAGGRDRHEGLLRALRAGQEIPLETTSRKRGVEWHPIAGTLVRAALVVALVYLAVVLGARLLRDTRVDAWTGPDDSVRSGQRLDGCAPVDWIDDDSFPSWIRFDGKIYRLTDTLRPMGSEPDPDFPATGYSLGPMTLYRVTNTPDGAEGRIVLVRLERSPAGRIFRLTPECT